jgi:Ni,Fe-hydrogenase III large subunit
MIYSEFFNSNKKATIEKMKLEGYDETFQKWEVTLYINNRVIQKITTHNHAKAANIAEDFVQNENGGAQSLLNEYV